MKFSPELFWDVSYDTIKWDAHEQWVICRVLEHGNINDWHEMRKLYSDEKIINAAKNTRYLSKKTLHFVHHIFDIPLQDFRCYKLMQSHPEQWIF